MKPIWTRILLGGALAGTAALAYFAPTEGADGNAETSAALVRTNVDRQPNRPGEPAAKLALDKMERLMPDAATPDLFKGMSWYVPPPPPPPPPEPPPPPPPPPPSAPPLPYVYIGQYVDGVSHLALLQRGDRLLTAGAGDVIDNIYQVNSVAGGVLTLTYLPLKIQQTMNIGAVK